MRFISAVIDAIERFFRGIGPFEDAFTIECATAITSEKLSVIVRRFLDGSILQGQTFLVIRIESPEGHEVGIQRADVHLTMQHVQRLEGFLGALLQEISPDEEGGEEEQLIPRLFRNSLVAQKLAQSAIERRQSIDYEFGPLYFEADLLKNYKYKERLVHLKAYVTPMFYLHSTLRRTNVQQLLTCLAAAKERCAELVENA
jgi:hypothetical protein